MTRGHSGGAFCEILAFPPVQDVRGEIHEMSTKLN